MSLPNTFAGATEPELPWLDQNFDAVGLLGTLPCLCSGSNNLTLTPNDLAPQPDILALQPGLRAQAIAATTNTGAVTANVAATGPLPVYKDTPGGPATLTGGEIVAGNSFVLTYDAALNAGAGGWHLGSATSSSAGTVTGVVAGTGLAGGTITGTGTISLAAIASHDLLANTTGGSAAPGGATLSAVLDAAIDNTQGDILYRGSALWAALTPGVTGAFLQTGGSGANPTWAGGISLGIAAGGSSLSAATSLTAQFNQVTTVGSGQGVALAASLGVPQTVFNQGANTLKVYPPSGSAQIDGNGGGNAVTITTLGVHTYVMLSPTQGYTVS